MLFHFIAGNYIILQIASPRTYCITALTHPTVYLSIVMTAPAVLSWGLWGDCSIWWCRGVQLQEWNLQTWAESSYPPCSESLRCLQLPSTTSTWKNTWKASVGVSTIQMPDYRSNLLWSEMSTSLSREQAHPTQGSRQGIWVCSSKNTFTFPASTQNIAAASVWATRNKTFMSSKGKSSL